MLFRSKLNDSWTKIMHVLIAGGCSKAKEKEVHDSCELLTIKINDQNGQCQATSEYFASLNQPRRGANLCKLLFDRQQKFDYVIVGGCSSEKSHMNSLEIYDRNKKCWTFVDDAMDEGRSCFASSIQSNNIIHCLGGWNGLECMRTVEEIEIQKFNTCDDGVLSFNVDRQRRRTTVGGEASLSNQLALRLKNSCCTDSFTDSVIIGGWDGNRTLDTIFRYDAVAIDPFDKLKFLSRLPYPIECHACVFWPRAKKILVVGGFDGITIRDDISVIDVETLETFTFSCKLRQKRECLCAELIDDYLIVAGGWDGYEALRSVEVFKLSFVSGTVNIEPIQFFDCLLKESRNRACSIIFDE